MVSGASIVDNGKFLLKVEKRTVDFVEYIQADYILVATGSSRQVNDCIFCFLNTLLLSLTRDLPI